MAQVHRFHDAVAVSVGNGWTVYLDPDTANKLGKALNDCARDIRLCSFTDSPFHTVEIDEGEQADVSKCVKRRKQERI